MPSRKRNRPEPDFVTCFGVGDGWPCPDRHHSSFLYTFGGSCLLVDCGECLSSSYSRSGHSYEALDGILLSHLHSDHVGGLFMFLQGMWLEKRRRPLTIYLPDEGIQPLKRMLKAVYLFEELIGFPLRFESLHPGKAIEIGTIHVTPYATQHLAQLRATFGRQRRQAFECFSFVLEASGRRVGHSADIGFATDLDPLLANPLDHLVCELAHCDLDAICQRLIGVRSQIARVTFVHLSRELWNVRADTRRRLKKWLEDVPFVIAQDGQRVGF